MSNTFFQGRAKNFQARASFSLSSAKEIQAQRDGRASG